MGKKVTVIVRSDRLLKEKIGAKGSKIIEEKLRGQGIDFRFSANVKRFEGEGKLNKLLLDTGETLDCQLAIVAVGIVPNVDFAKSSGVEIDRGIVIDQKTLTSLSDVYACGDCCQIKNKYTGEYFLPGNWYFALVSGKIAGNNMAGADEILDEMPQVTKVVSGLTLGFVGTIAEEYIDQEYSKDGRYLQFYKKNNITIGISSINLADRMARMKEVIGKKSIFDL
jgi:NADPH-dependent 2,4-dienoyl-CoA reductase/sulfur reductase-like enzyme